MYKDLNANLDKLKESFNNSVDLTIRTMQIKNNSKIAIISMEGMCNKEGLTLSVMTPINNFDFTEIPNVELSLKDTVLSASDVSEVDNFKSLLELLMSGFAIVLIDNCEIGLAVGFQGFSFRGVNQPDNEISEKESKEGFTEPLRINMTLLRRRIKSPLLKFETLTVGSVSNTQVCLCYLHDRVPKDLIDEIKKRLSKCNLEIVLAAGNLTPFLQDKNKRTIFSTIGVTERPDTMCGKIQEGRVGILVDGTPSSLIVPYLFMENFQSMDDYSKKPYFASFTRILKYVCYFLCIYFPAFYIAFTVYYPDFYPYKLHEHILSETTGMPLPLFLEVILMNFLFEIMREAGLRIPRPLGHAVSIIGALVIGESAVNSGIISSPTLMVLAFSAICSYVIPDLYPSVTVMRFLLIISSGIFGLWGIGVVSALLIYSICSTTSFGVPFMYPFFPFSLFAMRDTVLRFPWKKYSDKTFNINDVKKKRKK